MQQKIEHLIEFYLGNSSEKPNCSDLNNEQLEEFKVTEELIKLHPFVRRNNEKRDIL
jgi:hypothetical protein